jgi:phospholipid/cholesterol/gamma-HCH transport system ATP-binding protein
MACAKMTADRIMILKDGVIHAEGTYTDLENSDDEWIRSFLYNLITKAVRYE